MSRAKYAKAYNDAEYLPLTPEDASPDRFVYKFNSVEHMLSYVEHLDKNFKHASSQFSSHEENGNDFGWYASQNFEQAFDKIRGTEFDEKGVTTLQKYIRSVRHSSRFADDGYEMDIPEVLAKSERYWLNNDSRRSASRFFDDTLFINSSYNSNTNAEEARTTGLRLLEEIYKLGIIPRKVVCFFWADNVTSRGKDLAGSVPVFIDVSFRDLNGVAKAMHPATFRRMVFRIKEIMPDLAMGYGHSVHSPTERGMTEIANLIGADIPGQVRTLLGLPQKA